MSSRSAAQRPDFAICCLHQIGSFSRQTQTLKFFQAYDNIGYLVINRPAFYHVKIFYKGWSHQARKPGQRKRTAEEMAQISYSSFMSLKFSKR